MKKIILLLVALVAFVATAAAQDTKASFPGGEKALQAYLAKNLTYPAPARENGVEGVVGVAFVVKADGTIGNIKIRRMVDPDLEAEAIRLVKTMPAWNPAQGASGPVDSTVDLDIPFTLEPVTQADAPAN